ncbi:MAG TPA: RagB/SusD family nutrient uptake outer membrane protein [Chitinophagaceae bacterium]|nr:RagB/SusD family nutrient uptake outer membrane protein [Chitinophagaceae bacterium]
MKLAKIAAVGLIGASVLASCTKLDEKLNGELTGTEANQLFGGSNPDVSSLLKGCYDAMRAPYQDQAQWWAAQEHTSDEVIGPTRGGDWDDNGVWRVLHNHRWDADHAFLADTYRNLGRVVFATTDLLKFNPPAQAAAEARYLRAYAMFSMLDGWNQVPYREPGADISVTPKVRSGVEAADYIIAELNAILPALPNGPAYTANKDAARALLMKVYLNKGVFTNRATPTFAAADMQQVITLADQIINSGTYQLTNYFDNFAPNNETLSRENIFTARNLGGVESGNVRSRWFCGLHYNQNPSGWNGFTTIADFYNKFDATDPRRGGPYAGQTNVGGINVGFLVGQQRDQNGVALRDRKGNPLVFTTDIKLIETGNDLEVKGIRVVKYPIDYTGGDNANNDYVYLRYSDVLLMKAEALLRTNQAAAALTIVNQIRSFRGATPLATLTNDNLIDERGRELYWEGWRRQDLIRFGKFLGTWNEKPASGTERLLFPIPNRSLAANPNLKQNPGY